MMDDPQVGSLCGRCGERVRVDGGCCCPEGPIAAVCHACEQLKADLARVTAERDGLAHAVDRRPLCPDCRDKTKADDECLRCRYQRAEERLARVTAERDGLRASAKIAAPSVAQLRALPRLVGFGRVRGEPWPVSGEYVRWADLEALLPPQEPKEQK